VADFSPSLRTETTLYDVLASPAPEGLQQGETRVTKSIETSDEEPAAFPGVSLDG
jgi:hypothetical protein